MAPSTDAQAPDHDAALAMYRCRAGYYDLQLAPYEPIRQRAVQCLRLQPGQVVLDIGCGTGMSLELLRDAVGPGGQVVGVDQCPEMIQAARQRVHRHGWDNVDIVCVETESARLPVMADAVLFHFTHDILQSAQALDRVQACLKPGAHVAATGLKWTTPWLGVMNSLVWWNAMQSITTFQGMDAPWKVLTERGAVLEVEDWMMGTIYVAHGRWP